MVSVIETDLKSLNRADLETYVRQLLAQSEDHVRLRALLEETAAANLFFPSLSNLWGPEIYRRNRVLFRPLILSNFASGRLNSTRVPSGEIREQPHFPNFSLPVSDNGLRGR